MTPSKPTYEGVSGEGRGDDLGPDGKLDLLVEAMTKQIHTLHELVEVTRSLAVSEQRESLAELIEALNSNREATLQRSSTSRFGQNT